MRKIKFVALVFSVFTIAAAKAHDVIDMSDLFAKKQRQSVIRQKKLGCEINLEKSAKLIDLPDRPNNRPVEIAITNSPTVVEITDQGISVTDVPAVALVGATPNIQNVFERLSDLRFHDKKFESADEMNRFANIMYLAAQEVFQDNEDDVKRNHLLTLHFYTMMKTLPPDVRYKFLTAYLAGIELEHAFNVDPSFPDLVLDWRIQHFEHKFTDPLDDQVINRYSLVQY